MGLSRCDYECYGTAFDSELLAEPRIDLEMAWSFLESIDPGGLFCLQTFDDSPRKRQALVKVLHAKLSDFLSVANTLAALNDSGAGIFFCVNQTDGQARRNENITRLRAFFVDADGMPRPRTWHAPPDLVVWRDPVHWHAYWRLNGALPFGAFKYHQQRLASFYRTDPSICDLARVMRLPGFLHRKQHPVLVRYARG